MSALTGSAELQMIERSDIWAGKQYATADVFYPGSLVELNLTTGLYAPLGVTGAGAVFAGICYKGITTAASGTQRVSLDVTGKLLSAVPVTGTTADTDVGKLVYCTTDNANSDLTLTRAATDSIPVGRVIRWITGTDCDVLLFSLSESMSNHLSGAGRRSIYSGYHEVFTAGFIIGSASTGLKLNGTGRIVAIDAFVVRVPTSNSNTTDIAPLINNTAVTSAVITFLGSANQTLGARVATIVQPTAANVFHDGDVLSWSTTGGSPVTDGALWINAYAEAGL